MPECDVTRRSTKPDFRPLASLASAMLGLLLATGAGASADVDDAVQDIRNDGSYQIELPVSARSDARPPDLDLAWLADVAEILFWLAVAAAVIWTIVHLARARWCSADANAMESTEQSIEVVADSTPKPTSSTLVRAEQLAAEGRHDEAIHALLLDALGLITERRRNAIPDALTSREILAERDLTTVAKGPLGALVEAVERHHFGGRTANAEDYARCRARHGELAIAL